MKLRPLLVLLFGLLLALPAWANKTFVYCSEGSPSTFNPQLGTDGPTFNATSRILYDRLVEFEYGGTKIVPGLAESWSVSKDGLQFTFKLRKGVQFHSTKDFKPTREFNADDVLFTFDRMRLKDHSFHKVNGGNYEYFNSMDMGKLIKNISKVDSHTVRFELSQKEAPFLANLAMDFASLLSAEYGQQLLAKKTPEKIDLDPVGTGPFVLTRYVKDNSIRYESHPKYYQGAAKIDRIVFSIVVDPSVRTQKLRAGECHLIAEPSPNDLKTMKANKKILVMEQAGLNVGYLALNVEKPPLNNLKVRQAIHHALNRVSYLDTIYLAQAELAKNPIPPSMWSYNLKTKDYAYDIEKAKKLLAEAGFKDGFDTEIWTLPVSRPYNPSGKKMGELMQADLLKIGIRAKLVTYDWPTYLEKSRKGEHQMIQLGWTGDNGDPDNFLNVLLGCVAVQSGSNVARWCNKEFDRLIIQAKQVTDVKKRAELYLKAQDVFKQQAPWVTLAHAKVFRAMSDTVQNYKISPFGTESFYYLDLK